MTKPNRNEPAAPAVVAPFERPVGRLVLAQRLLAPPDTGAALVPGAPRCCYCWQMAPGWDASDAARGKRSVYGGIEYHCYAAKCWD